MDLIITEKKATICLNMIVKNESHIIENTLEKLCKKINFDYWVICDTGSTDNTPQIITDFFTKKGIKGELYFDEWQNFAHNRTLALEKAYKKTNLLLVFDADDEIVGDIIIPSEVLFDEYLFKFGSSFGTSYTRVLMINNYKKFEYLSVIHEFISCKEGPAKSTVIEGDYFVVSGRAGSRNLDPDKYLKDAFILEKAHAEALKKNDGLFHRYAFYCANSYKDCGRLEDAIKWYKITIGQEKQWSQERYVSCLYLFECFEMINEREKGFFYLVKAFAYDTERVECLYPLLVHYCCENMHRIAYNYYLNIKDFFENTYLQSDNLNKLFISQDKYNFFVPYYMILIADKVQDFDCVIKMYEIVFIKKQRMFEEWYIKNLLYNLQFFLKHVPTHNTKFIELANDYLMFVNENGVKIQNFDFLLKDEYKNAGIELDRYIITEITNKPQKFSKDICKQSKNILIYTGFSDIEWNYTYMQNNALGGSEKAVAYLSKCFPKDYTIYISGHVKNESIGNVQYIHLNELTKLINDTHFHTLIVSRYISFYELFKECSFYQSFIWAHDVVLLPYGCSLNDTQILTKWDKYINGCICLTEWHKAEFIKIYPILKDKITLINNGIDLKSFNIIDTDKKIKNKFIYSSRPDRGLNILLSLWPLILEKIPDATLVVSSYGKFPSNEEEKNLKNIIDSNDTIKFLGKLNTEQLYNEMESSEYWLYPTHWPETSCITALEMLMSEVICLYYPVAGLTYTMDKYGIQIKPYSEIETLVSLTENQKDDLRKNGREYAEKCSWINRYNRWYNLLSLEQSIITNPNNKNIAIFNSFNFHYEMFGYIIEYCKNNNYLLSIFTSLNNTLGWIDFYKNHFKPYNFEINQICEFELNRDKFDIIFVTTDDDYVFKSEWITDKCISVNHINNIRRPEFKNNLGTRPFIKISKEWALPCYSIFKEKDKDISSNNDINIALIGGLAEYNYNTINRLTSSRTINLHIISRSAYKFHTVNVNKDKIKVTLYDNMDTIKLIDFLKKCDYILTDTSYNLDHVSGISMSGSIPLAFSTLTPLILSKGNNSMYNFKNVIEFDIETKDEILIEKSHIDISGLEKEREIIISKFNNYIQTLNRSEKNSALIIDPRNNENLPYLINDFKKKLGENWKIIFYCGKGLQNEMDKQLEEGIEIRELTVDNFTINEYSDFMKTKELWESLYGEFVLTFQADTYIINEAPYNIDYFMNMNKSYIGGNMDHGWNELNRENIYIKYRNFNGGLSLRKRNDMIKIIDTFGTEKTVDNSQKIQTDPEDVYFTLGCYKLNYPIGDTQECQHFSINRIWYNKFFGIHKPIQNVFENLKEISEIYCKETNTFILKPKKEKEKENSIKIIDCFTFYNELNMLNYRLNVLNDVVDFFILVEARQTHIGKTKSLFFEENKQMFEKFNYKIIHIVVDLPFNDSNIDISNNDQWKNEKYQRNCVKNGIDNIKEKLTDNDYIIISDVDEIPDPKTLHNIKQNKLKICDINSLSQDFYYYNLNSKRNEKWFLSKILSYKKYKELNTDCDNLRFYNCNKLENGGWHLSYFGDANFIKNKLENFAHQEYNSDDFTDVNKIEDKIKKGLDLFNRQNNHFSNKIIQIPITENNYLPPLFENYLSSFYTKHSPKIYCFIHSYTTLRNGTRILDYLINIIEKTGLIDILECLFINNLGVPITNKYGNEKYIITNYSYKPNYYESPTFNKIIQFSKENPNSYMLYIHTKGISYDIYDEQLKSVFDWINLMLYFLVEKYDICIQKLNDGYESIGCNYNCGGNQYPKHYSGNFWWANTNLLKKLNCLNEEECNKNICEFILFSKDHPHYNIYHSKIDHYQNRYPMEIYSQDSIINNINKNKSPLEIFNTITKNNITIGFHSNQLCERGTEIALYDYAYHNEELYNNKSIILYDKYNPNNDQNVIDKFEKQFKCYAYEKFSDIEKFIVDEKIDYFYTIKSGENDNLIVKSCPNLIHAVFKIDPHGEKYAAVSKYLADKHNNIIDYVPHMINLPEHTQNMREELKIPNDSIVVGRYGGYYMFDLHIAHRAIQNIIEQDPNIIFLFVNTNKFYEHPQIIYLDKIIDPAKKVKFINTCDTMIHAGSEGETFGLAVAEFSSLNKPVITSVSKINNSHIEILGSKGIIYDTEESLINIFKNIRTIIKSKDDWNAYREYTPKKVMKRFMDVFIGNSIDQIDINKTADYNPLFLVTSLINLYHDTIYSVEERLTQTIKTINSIYEHCPNATAVILEASNYKYNNQQFEQYNNLYIYYVTTNVIGQHKSVGECLIIKEFLHSYFYSLLVNNNKINIIFKLSGRYWLNENFKLTNFNIMKHNFKNVTPFTDENGYDNPHNMTEMYCITSLFSFVPNRFDEIVDSLNYVIENVRRYFCIRPGSDIEHFIYNYFHDKKSYNPIDKLGVSGFVSPTGKFLNY